MLDFGFKNEKLMDQSCTTEFTVIYIFYISRMWPLFFSFILTIIRHMAVNFNLIGRKLNFNLKSAVIFISKLVADYFF